MSVRCLNTAIVGIGGFAGAHHAALLDMERAGRAKVVATCDPALDSPGVRCAKYEFKNRGVHMYRDFDDLLAAHGDHLDVIHLVSPIRFHAAHHRACVERGIACYLEKPPTLDPEELEAMIATDTGAGIKTQVGFNHIAQPWRLRLKERVLAGEFGRMRRVAFQGLWRRPLSYWFDTNTKGIRQRDCRGYQYNRYFRTDPGLNDAIPLSAIEQPSRTLMMWDSIGVGDDSEHTTCRPPGYCFPKYRHNGKINLLMVSGAVVPRRGINNPDESVKDTHLPAKNGGINWTKSGDPFFFY
ncbi:oxidoreductase [Opitutaceae bacterium TAV5]|nr:oxidoreductase [Opitutaceae bacterium TAV5]